MQKQPQEFFIKDECLIRKSTSKTGKAYKHKCPLEDFDAVIEVICANKDAGLTLKRIQDAIPEVKWYRIAMVFAFVRHCEEVFRKAKYYYLRNPEDFFYIMSTKVDTLERV